MTISLTAAFGLFAVMLVLALVPGVSVLTVTARAASAGFAHGAAATAGMVGGDLVFILAALLGLAVLAEAAGPALALLPYLAGAYLVFLGLTLWRARGRAGCAQVRGGSLGASFGAGLAVTLGDQKALLFYFGLLPAFVDLSSVTAADVVLIVFLTVFSLGGAKLAYAYVAARGGAAIGAGPALWLNRLAAACMIAAGLVLAVAGWGAAD